MIIRIMSEGQFELPDDAIDSLNELDDKLEAAIENGDEPSFGAALGALLDRVRSIGEPVALDSLVASDLVLPYESASLAEVRDLLSEDGLIPG